MSGPARRSALPGWSRISPYDVTGAVLKDRLANVESMQCTAGLGGSADDAGTEGDRDHPGAVTGAQLAGDARKVTLDRQRR